MNENFKLITETLIREGFHDLTQTDKLDFRITPYSLNTKLSFKFENLQHFIEFLRQHNEKASDKAALLQTTLMELGLDANDFFYVNFFEKGKEAEM